MPLVYHAATRDLDVDEAPAKQQPPIDRWEDDLPRRKVVRQLKETLVKSTILVGAPASLLCDVWHVSGEMRVRRHPKFSTYPDAITVALVRDYRCRSLHRSLVLSRKLH